MRAALKIFNTLAAVLGTALWIRIPPPTGLLLTPVKTAAQLLAPLITLVSGASTLWGLHKRDKWLTLTGLWATLTTLRHIQKVRTPQHSFEKAFGPDWQREIPPEQHPYMLQRRWNIWLPRVTTAVRWERDIVYRTIPAKDGKEPRQLLCDIWQPPEGNKLSGLGILYFHGGGWHFLDKDMGTRPFFKHLAAQGHIVMDVSYRSCPAVDVYEMMGDVKHAIAWMKAKAPQYGINPHNIILAGGSAGAHLALLAAYAPGHPAFTPKELQMTNLTARGVIAYYPPSNLLAYRRWTTSPAKAGQQKLTVEDYVVARFLEIVFGDFDRQAQEATHQALLRNLVRDTFDKAPDAYRLASPVTHVSPQCPPTLLIQGAHDALVPVEGTRALYKKLIANKVPVVYVEIPQTEHAFDVGVGELAQHSAAAQTALYDTERFLALLVKDSS